MIITTGPTVEGKRVTAYHGIVAGDAILGANAIIAVDLDHETVAQSGSMLMVSVSGTAVTVE
jgi:uncharacterized protein YbjQ (UPF0145 family)